MCRFSLLIGLFLFQISTVHSEPSTAALIHSISCGDEIQLSYPLDTDYFYWYKDNNSRQHYPITDKALPANRIIVVNHVDCEVEIYLHNGDEYKSMSININNPLKIPALAPATSALFASLVKWLLPQTHSATTAGANRGDIENLIAPIFATLPTEKYVVANKQRLHLAWQGGIAPYQLTLYQKNHPSALCQTSTFEPFIAWSLQGCGVDFKINQQYRIVIDNDLCRLDALDPRFCYDSVYFKIVSQTKWQAQLDNIPIDKKLNPKQQQLSQWLWLMQFQRQWLFEVYQHISEQRDSPAIDLLWHRGFQ